MTRSGGESKTCVFSGASSPPSRSHVSCLDRTLATSVSRCFEDGGGLVATEGWCPVLDTLAVFRHAVARMQRKYTGKDNPKISFWA